MPWERDGDGLKLVGDCHYDVAEIRRLIEELRLARNQPGTVCSLLDELLSTGRASKELVWRLSKWCRWDDTSERTARAIASQLFHGNICRRLRDQADKPIPDRATAEADYQNWVETTVQTGQGLPPSAVFPDEVDQAETYLEGAAHLAWVNSYERDPAAREKCLAHYGPKCIVCGFEFGEAYDGMGKGFMHVHHLKKLSDIGHEYCVDPVDDLRPVCPNCHAVIHLNKQPFTIEDVQAMVKRSRERQTLVTS